MATGRIGVTPTLRTRWSKAPAGGTTSLSGLDDNSVSLVYDVGYEAVYRNGALLSRGNDYTATDGTTITLIDATIAGDIIEVFANELVPLTDAISKGQFTAKGSLLSASAASTPAVLAVGTNNQVLTVDSATTSGLKWATPGSTWTTWTPTRTNITIGNGTETARYLESNGTIFVHYKLVWGSTTSLSGNPDFTLPVTGKSTSDNFFGTANLRDAGVLSYFGQIEIFDAGAKFKFGAISASSTYTENAGVSATVPFTWGTGDIMVTYFWYEKA